MLLVNDVSTFYGKTPALRNVSLQVKQGEIVALLGRNGAGKTTMLNTISGIIKPKSGRILLDDERIDCLEPHVVARKGVVHVPEGRKIFAELTVKENLEIGAFPIWRSRAQRLEQVLVIFPRLKERFNQLGSTLSGGEQQMLAIGRGLMANPRFLLLDEPSLGLAPLVVEGLFQAIQAVNRSGVTILLVEQNALLALELAGRVYVIQNGCNASEGAASELRNSDAVREAYLDLKRA